MIAFSGFSHVRRLLCLGAHSDDIEIGAGATVLRAVRENPSVEVTWCVLSGNEVRQQEARHGAEHILGPRVTKSVILGDFTDSNFPEQRHKIKQFFEQSSEVGRSRSDPHAYPGRCASRSPNGQ